MVPSQATAWQAVCVVALHVQLVPLPHAPLAPFGPQPPHPRSVASTLGFAQESGQAPAVVPQPVVGSHVEAQHSLAAPTVQAVVVGAQEQGLQVPAPSQVLEHDAG